MIKCLFRVGDILKPTEFALTQFKNYSHATRATVTATWEQRAKRGATLPEGLIRVKRHGIKSSSTMSQNLWEKPAQAQGEGDER